MTAGELAISCIPGIIVGIISGIFGGGWVGPWRQHKLAERREKDAARNAALGIIDRFIAESQKGGLPHFVFERAKAELNEPIFKFSSRFNNIGCRMKITKAWEEYQALQIKTIGKVFGRGEEPNQQIVAQERQELIGGFHRLREKIVDS